MKHTFIKLKRNGRPLYIRADLISSVGLFSFRGEEPITQIVCEGKEYLVDDSILDVMTKLRFYDGESNYFPEKNI